MRTTNFILSLIESLFVRVTMSVLRRTPPRPFDVHAPLTVEESALLRRISGRPLRQVGLRIRTVGPFVVASKTKQAKRASFDSLVNVLEDNLSDQELLGLVWLNERAEQRSRFASILALLKGAPLSLTWRKVTRRADRNQRAFRGFAAKYTRRLKNQARKRRSVVVGAAASVMHWYWRESRRQTGPKRSVEVSHTPKEGRAIIQKLRDRISAEIDVATGAGEIYAYGLVFRKMAAKAQEVARGDMALVAHNLAWKALARSQFLDNRREDLEAELWEALADYLSLCLTFGQLNEADSLQRFRDLQIKFESAGTSNWEHAFLAAVGNLVLGKFAMAQGNEVDATDHLSTARRSLVRLARTQDGRVAAQSVHWGCLAQCATLMALTGQSRSAIKLYRKALIEQEHQRASADSDVEFYADRVRCVSRLARVLVQESRRDEALSTVAFLESEMGPHLVKGLGDAGFARAWSAILEAQLTAPIGATASRERIEAIDNAINHTNRGLIGEGYSLELTNRLSNLLIERGACEARQRNLRSSRLAYVRARGYAEWLRSRVGSLPEVSLSLFKANVGLMVLAAKRGDTDELTSALAQATGDLRATPASLSVVETLRGVSDWSQEAHGANPLCLPQVLAFRRELAAKATEFAELQWPQAIDAGRPQVAAFHASWLAFCIGAASGEIPSIVASMQGRKIASLVLNDLDEWQRGASVEGSALGELIALRRALRRQVFGLSSFATSGAGSSLVAHRPKDSRSQLDRPPLQAALAEYQETLLKYKRIKAEMVVTPASFGAPLPLADVDSSRIQARLSENEAVVLLLQTEDSDSGAQLVFPPKHVSRLPRSSHALLLRGSSHRLVHLPDLGSLPEQVRAAVGTRSGGAGLRYSGESASAPSVEVGDLQSELSQALWAPLLSHLEGLKTLHVVTHGELHVLPLSLGAPERLRIYQYPGLVFYWLQHIAVQRPPIPLEARGALALQVHSPAQGSDPPPIPFVDAEAQIVQSMWDPAHTHSPLPLHEELPVAVVHLAGHGQATKGEDACLILGTEQRLGLHELLRSRIRPEIVYLSACLVGRTSEDLDGDPLGMVSGFFLRGARCVVAPLVPISDFYAPLLAALFHHALAQQRSSDQPLDAHAALGQAKSQLQDGHWPQAVIDGVLRAYEDALTPQLKQVLAAPDAKDGLRRRVGHWLSSDHEVPYSKGQLRGLRDEIQTMLHHGNVAEGASFGARRIAQMLVDARSRLGAHPEVQDLLRYVQVWGAPAQPG